MGKFDYFKEKLKKLDYPVNHTYDPETFIPTNIMKNRITLLKRNAPELIHGNGTLLDVGSNKGFISFYLRYNYDKIVAYEPLKEYVNFCNELKNAHGIINIEFNVGTVRDLPVDTYDVIYVGNVHHYLYNEAKEYEYRFWFIDEFKKRTNNIIIIDGVFEYKDFAIQGMSKNNNWDNDKLITYTLENHINAMKPEFRLIRFGINGIGNYTNKWENYSGRHTAVFKRMD